MTNTLSKSDSWKIFNDIAPKYDFLNHLLSFGLDIHWRAQLARYLPNLSIESRVIESIASQSQQTQQPNRPNGPNRPSGLKVLDIASGTADVLLSLFKHNKNIRLAHGIDLSDQMLAIGRKKIIERGFEKQILLQHGDANQIPFEPDAFDAITIAFGIRNMEEPIRVLREMHRVLNSGGRAIVLEFSMPANRVLRSIYLFYLRHIVPVIAAVFSGHYAAYRYLNQTIEAFPCGDDFCALMKEAGFEHVTTNLLLFGVATIYTGDKS